MEKCSTRRFKPRILSVGATILVKFPMCTARWKGISLFIPVVCLKLHLHNIVLQPKIIIDLLTQHSYFSMLDKKRRGKYKHACYIQ